MQTEMHGSRQQLREQIQRSMLIDQLLKQEVDKKSCRFAGRGEGLLRQERGSLPAAGVVHLPSISIVPPRTATPEQAKEARKKADDALKQAKATKSYQEFGLLAEKISEDDYRVNMGDHKVVPADKLPPQVIKAFQAMKPGTSAV